MPKKSRKISEQEQKVMRTLILDNGSQYINKVQDHISNAAKEHNVEDHKIARITPEDFYKNMRENRDDFAKYVGGFDYIASSGSPKNRKYDTEIHKFIAENKNRRAVFLGLCHGAQQDAVAHGAELKKTEYMHRGDRESEVKSEHPVLEGFSSEGKIKGYGHHQYYIPIEKAGSQLEIIADAESPHTKERFVEMYKIKGKEHYGAQFHAEKGDGTIIKNLFKRAYKNKA